MTSRYPHTEHWYYHPEAGYYRRAPMRREHAMLDLIASLVIGAVLGLIAVAALL